MEKDNKKASISNMDEYTAIAKDYDESEVTQADENAADSVLLAQDTVSDADGSHGNISENIDPDNLMDGETLVRISDFTSGNNFENSKEKYSNNMSSAITFFICGIGGFVVLALNWFGVLNLIKGKNASSIFTYVVMGLVFLIFLAIAVTTLRAALKAKANISKENETIDKIRQWIKDNISVESIEASYNGSELAEEMRYFYRSSYVKDKVNAEFPTIPADLLDSITDDFIENCFNSED